MRRAKSRVWHKCTSLVTLGVTPWTCNWIEVRSGRNFYRLYHQYFGCTYNVPVSLPFLKFRRNFSKIPQVGLTGTTTSILCVPILDLCPHHFLKANRNSFQNPTGILTKVSPNFLLTGKKEALRGFLNRLVLWQSFFIKSAPWTMITMTLILMIS